MRVWSKWAHTSPIWVILGETEEGLGRFSSVCSDWIRSEAAKERPNRLGDLKNSIDGSEIKNAYCSRREPDVNPFTAAYNSSSMGHLWASWTLNWCPQTDRYIYTSLEITTTILKRTILYSLILVGRAGFSWGFSFWLGSSCGVPVSSSGLCVLSCPSAPFLWGRRSDFMRPLCSLCWTLCFFFSHFEMVLLRSPGWPQTHDPSASPSLMLGLWACTTMPIHTES